MEKGEIQNLETKHVGIVGGGRGGLELLKMLSKSKMTVIDFVVDLNPDSPAVAEARKKGIETFMMLEQALSRSVPDFIFEATGSANVLNKILAAKDQKTEVINSKAALYLFQLLENIRISVAREVADEITLINKTIDNSLDSINKFVDGIKSVSIDLGILAINARIEAARAGNDGKGFSVVANEVKNAAGSASKMADEIADINQNMTHISKKIGSSVMKLTN